MTSPVRGLFSGGTQIVMRNFITIATLGDVKTLEIYYLQENGHSGGSNPIRGIYAGGSSGPTNIDYITINTLAVNLYFNCSKRNSAGCASATVFKLVVDYLVVM